MAAQGDGMSVPAWVTAACRTWVRERARRFGEGQLSELELRARVMRMSEGQIRAARKAYEASRL